MTLRMPKVVLSTAEKVAHSVLWGAVSRIGVPVILGLVMTGIPAHLLWAAKVNEEIALAKRDAVVVAADLKAIKDAARDDQRAEASLRADVASLKTDSAAVLRAINRLETQFDRLSERRP